MHEYLNVRGYIAQFYSVTWQLRYGTSGNVME